MTPRPDRRRTERGSVLLLFPAAVLVVVVLAAMAVDASIAFLGERELSAAVAAAANDAATRAIDERAFYDGGRVELDPGGVARVAEARVRTSLSTGRHRDLTVRAVVVRAGGGCDWALRVEASAQVRYLFAPALPGGPNQATVGATAISSPVQVDMKC